jgi:hypothetical protein
LTPSPTQAGWDGPVALKTPKESTWRNYAFRLASKLAAAAPRGADRPARLHTKTGEVLEAARPGGRLKKALSAVHKSFKGIKAGANQKITGWDITVSAELAPHARAIDEGYPSPLTIRPKHRKRLMIGFGGPETRFPAEVTRPPIPARHYVKKAFDEWWREMVALGKTDGATEPLVQWADTGGV